MGRIRYLLSALLMVEVLKPLQLSPNGFQGAN